MAYLFRIILTGVIFIASFLQSRAQAEQRFADTKNKTHLLAGQWQLVKVFAEGKDREVKKDEYNCVITFNPDHKYKEEVLYESDHWIIEGQWKLNERSDTLAITNRHYTKGMLEKSPKDILLQLTQLTATEWTGCSNEKGQPVKMYYHKLPCMP